MRRLLVLVLLASSLALAGGEDYKPRPVIAVGHDDQDIPEPRKQKSRVTIEFIGTLLAEVQKAADIPRTVRRLDGDDRARNVNVMDEVPDSTWFTNRITTGKITPADVERGANAHPPPAFDGPILILDGKKSGATPGFIAKDSAGVVWHVKFDPPGYPEMQSAAEVISSRLLWAAGYNVPEEWIATFRRDQLTIDPKATVPGRDHESQPMTEAALDQLLSKVARRADGSYRVVASRHLDHLKGPFRFRGTRAGDKNDVVPHEHRRDIRGLRIICAWINHEDIKSDNTVTEYVTENGRRFLKHYLWDFGSTLGSDGVAPKYVRSGHANALDIRLIGERLVTLGLWQPRWKRHPLPVLFPSVGRFGSQYFQPDKWKPTMPNRAFDNLTKADAFWAAKIVGSFTDDHIRAAVRAGQLSSRAAEDYLVKTLAERRDIILKQYFGCVSPVQNFTTGPVHNRTQRSGQRTPVAALFAQ